MGKNNPYKTDTSSWFFIDPSGDYAYWEDKGDPAETRFKIVDKDGKVLGVGSTKEEALKAAGYL